MNHGLLQSPIAIVGMSCRLPGATNLDEYWQLLCQGRDAIQELPPGRLDRELYFSARKGDRGKTYSTLGGLVASVDGSACSWTDELRRDYDPCHRILCDVAAEACRHAGYDPFELPWRNAGVYVGHSGGSSLPGDLIVNTLAEETADILRDVPALAGADATTVDMAIRQVIERLRMNRPQRTQDGGPYVEAGEAAGLISRMFALSGPHISVDAACASSLVALMIATQALQNDQIDLAIIGGASFNKSDSLILFSQAQSCSATGSRPFDATADGLISSEGYVVIVAKTLARALADGDRVQAVIRGLGYSSDGRGRSLWAPRKEGQLEAMRRAYPPDVDPRRVQLIEAHATSTQVGDATELEALGEFFGPLAENGQRIPVGSVKSNIGHTLETAGLASLLKVVLAIQHRRIPPTIHLGELSPTIPWSDIPFVVPTSLQFWPAPALGPRLAAVNAFGIGGLNIHAVVEEFDRQLVAASQLRSRRPPIAPPKSSGSPVAEDEEIAIIGRGVVLPGALTLDAFRKLLRTGADPKGLPPEHRWRRGIELLVDGRPVTRLGGFIRDFNYDWKRHRIPPKQIAEANPLQFMLLDATEQALSEAGYLDRNFDRARTTTIVGTIFGGDFGNQLQIGLRLPEVRRTLESVLANAQLSSPDIARISAEFEAMFLRIKPALLDETGSFTSSTLASRIAKTFDLMGGAMAVDAGETSSFAALSVACNLLKSGACSLAICAAAQRSMDRTSYECLALNRRLAGTTGMHGPHGSVDGLVPGEGVAVVLLKRLSAARADGDRILGTIQGINAATDVADISRAVACAAERSWSTARPGRTTPEFVDAEIGVARLDAAEWSGLGAVGIERVSELPARGVSLAGQIGYTRAAHGLVSLIRATLELERPRPDSNLSNGMLTRLTRIKGNGDSTNGERPLVAISNYSTTGPCVLAYHARIEVAPVSPGISVRTGENNPASNTAASRIVRLSAADPNGLNTKIEAALVDPAGCLAAATQFAPDHRLRIAIVAATPMELREKLRTTMNQWQRSELRAIHAEQGIFLRRVACGVAARDLRLSRSGVTIPRNVEGSGRGITRRGGLARGSRALVRNQWAEQLCESGLEFKLGAGNRHFPHAIGDARRRFADVLGVTRARHHAGLYYGSQLWRIPRTRCGRCLVADRCPRGHACPRPGNRSEPRRWWQDALSRHDARSNCRSRR